MKFIEIYFVICIVWKEILAKRSTISLEKPAKTDYFDGLINYLKSESKLYQVLFILEDESDNTDPILNSLIKEVNQHFPSFSSNYHDMTKRLERNYIDNHEGRIRYIRSTLFIFQANKKNSMGVIRKKLYKINSNEKAALPRCLIMNTFNSTHKHLNSSLHSLWDGKFFDITIMTYNQNHQVKPFLSYINPFTKAFTALEITSKIQWFPDEVGDLKGQTSSDNNRRQIEGMKKRTTEISSQANSKLTRKTSKHFSEMSTPELQGLLKELDVTKNLRIQKIDDKNFNFLPETLNMIMLTITIFIIIILRVFFMKFSRTLCQIMFGIPASRESNYWLERIFFGSLLITCIVCTGYKY